MMPGRPNRMVGWGTGRSASHARPAGPACRSAAAAAAWRRSTGLSVSVNQLGRGVGAVMSPAMAILRAAACTQWLRDESPSQIIHAVKPRTGWPISPSVTHGHKAWPLKKSLHEFAAAPHWAAGPRLCWPCDLDHLGAHPRHRFGCRSAAGSAPVAARCIASGRFSDRLTTETTIWSRSTVARELDGAVGQRLVEGAWNP